MFVQSYVVNEASTSTANVNVILDGKAKNVRYGMTNAKSQIVTATDTVSTENVLVSEDIRASFVRTSTALIQLAPAMVFASRALVYARKVGRELTVQQWIRMPYNASRTALDMARLTLIPKPVLVTYDGLATTVRKVNYFIRIFILIGIIHQTKALNLIDF